MIEEDFLIFQAPKECMSWPCAWILLASKKPEKGPIKIIYNKKKCFLQCRSYDFTYSNHTSHNNITIGCSGDNVILISEHYRDILGITPHDITTSKNFDEHHHKKKYGIKKCKLKISYPQNKVARFMYGVYAACQHPDIYAKISIYVGMVSIVLGLVSFLQALFSIGLFPSSFSPQNSLPRNIYLVCLGGIAGHILTLLFLEKVTKETWIVCIGLLAVVYCIILYISQYS